MKLLWQLFWAFCRCSLFTFGGGLAILPMLQKEIVETHKWATKKEIIDYYAIGQFLPGLNAVNTAAFIGLKQKGLAGAIAGMLGVLFPSFIIILIIATAFFNFSDNPTVQHAIAGIRIAVLVLIINIVIGLWKVSIPNALAVLIFVAAFIAGFFFSVSPAYIIVIAAAAGICLSLAIRGRRRRGV